MRELAQGQVLVLEQAPVRGQVLVRGLVLVRVLEREQVPGLRIRRPPVRLTGPLSLPKKIIFYSTFILL
ncbi:MAG: hypothetical protein WBC50_00805 [Dehalococcoidales bacterium]